jgi:uncharacterized membrane protein
MPNGQDSSSVWLMKRNCSFTPKQVGLFYLSMCIFSSLIAGYFYFIGAWMVVPFAVVELTVLGIALLIYARHATDYEKIIIHNGLMDIEVLNGRRLTKKQWPLLWLRVKDPEISKDHSKSLIKIEYGNDFISLGAYIFPEKRQDLAYEIKCARDLALN